MKGITAMSAEIKLEQSQNGKLSKLTIHTATIWFSYETPVAYILPGVDGVVTSDKGWSMTTRRHIATIGDRRAPIDHEEFERGLMAIMHAVSGLYDTTTIRDIKEAITAAEITAQDRIKSIGVRSIDSLDAAASRLYNNAATYQEFASVFTVEELTRLSELCGAGQRAYDDEVFDALAITKGV